MTYQPIFALVSLGIFMAGSAHAQVRSGPADDEPYCREFTQAVTIGGKTQNGYGTACLQPDGSWEIQTPTNQTKTQPISATPTIQYVVQKEKVFIVPPRPFLVGTVLIGGRPHHFDDHFRPYRAPYRQSILWSQPVMNDGNPHEHGQRNHR